MHESIDVHELIRDPAARRLWILYKAATFLPLGDALELALEFGLSPKQVQGFRIGSAREIARRRAHTGNAFEAEQEASPTAIIDDIVRYLRQQDDVVVLQEDGGYLVNGRFRMTASELVARANRMRMRQRKPAFEVANGALSSGAPAAKSHPLFWEEPPANEPLVTNGFHKPERREPAVQLIL